MREIRIGKNEENQRIDKFLRKYMAKASLGFIYKMIRKKSIKVNGNKIDNDYILKYGDAIQLYLKEDTIESFIENREVRKIKRTFQIVYEDDYLLLVNKPYGLLVHGDSQEKKNTLINQVTGYLYAKGEYDPKSEKTFVPASVNRLDRNTSGIVIIGKNYETVQNLNQMIREKHHIRKFYLTVVKGQVKSCGELKGYLLKDERGNKVKIAEKEENGKDIHTMYRPLKTNKDYSLLEVEIITGRTHQIRLHLSAIGHPIVGDPKYGDKSINQVMKKKFGLENQFLHAYRISFEKCMGNLKYLEGKTFEAPLPQRLKEIEQSLFSER
ncbi:RluA family pseudouridine synthase [Thermotalea metallivorans]|uniref:Pseudouridine synthase n=1 Tax=Thermotalea metallivorans TaxID=520762 RepID=A0A140LEJ0_9FIRM|nr:RluA family pseudouridine synthase [Thermotalea metallivorans]KXG78965.1 Ribosomal large subunit pseudouridine synthase C [Thermotalea metallivorans]